MGEETSCVRSWGPPGCSRPLFREHIASFERSLQQVPLCLHSTLGLAEQALVEAEQFDVRYEQGVYVYGEVPYVYRDKARTVQSISKYIK